MIKSSKIYSELSIYTDNKIVLWGAGFFGRQYLEKLRWFEMNVVAFCDNNKGAHGTEIDAVPVISPDELQEMLKENDDIVVQIACETDEEVLVKQLQNLGVVNYISQKDMDHNLSYFKKYSDIDFDAKFPGNSDGNHIRLTKIDSEFSIYKNNKVILWGVGKFSRQMLDLFRYYKLEVEAFCDNDEELHGTEVNMVKVISPDKLKKMVDDGDDVMVQISDKLIDYNELHEQLKQIGVIYWVDYKECWSIFMYMKRWNSFIYNEKTIQKQSVLSCFRNNKLIVRRNYEIYECNEVVNVICMVGKTGDYTLKNTFDKNQIYFYATAHSVDIFDKDIFDNGVCKKIKIITAVREPIAIMLSEMYQVLAISVVTNASTSTSADGAFQRLNNIYYPYEKSMFLKNGGDVQYAFDKFVEGVEQGYNKTRCENFINQFCNKIVDIKKVPFDKEKGYAIVEEGNIEVFVYQLEKMNDIVKEVAEFVGGDFTEWEMGNVASDKWIADSYKQAQKEIKISQEYFDKCFSESYVHHFYSDEDIEKFKARWRPHIRENN